MIKIEPEDDLKRISENVSPVVYRFLYKWFQEREDGDEFQDSLYCSPYPIGSMGAMWIAESQEDIQGKEFVELIQYIIGKESLFIGVYLPLNGEVNSDIFIPGEILTDTNLLFLVSKVDSIERIDEEC